MTGRSWRTVASGGTRSAGTGPAGVGARVGAADGVAGTSLATGVDGSGVGRSRLTTALLTGPATEPSTAGGPAVTPSPSATVATAMLETSAAMRDRDGR